MQERTTMSKSKTITLKDKEVLWSFVNHTKNKYDSTEQEYSINVVLKEEEYKKLKKLGLKKDLKEKDGKTFITLQRNVLARDGKVLSKPPVFNKYGEPYEGMVGNGSICDVRVNVYEYTEGKFSFKYDGLMVKTLVEFNSDSSKNGFDFESKPKDDDDGAPFDTDDDDFNVI